MMDLRLFKPMKGVRWDQVKEANRRFPYLISPKIDGIRCSVVNGVPLTTSKKPVPNRWIREYLSHPSFSGLDGELVAGDAHGNDVIGRTQSLVMSHEKKGDWCFHVFDNFLYSGSFANRLERLFDSVSDPRIEVIEHCLVKDEIEISIFDEGFTQAGFEGSVLRDPKAPYDFGRCTPKEGYMIKLKAYIDEEAQIVGFEEKMHNANPLMEDLVTGRKTRSSAGDCDVGLGVLGSFILRHPRTGLEFKCGSGLTDDLAEKFWRRRDELLGKWVTYKTMKYGAKDRPRHPIFKRLRHRDDMDSDVVTLPQQGSLFP